MAESRPDRQPKRWFAPHLVPVLIGLATILLFHVVVVLNPNPNPNLAHEHGTSYEHTSWDEGYYLTIAREGYSLTNDNYRAWSTLPFSPGYPFLLRAFVAPIYWKQLHDKSWGPTDLFVARFVLSAILFLIACIGMGVLFRSFSDDPWRNHLALALFAVWPASFYFLTAYAESLYLPLAVWCLVCLRKRWFLLASVLAALALFTRSPAIILVPCICVVAIVDAWQRRRAQEASLLPGTLWLMARLALYVMICALGLVGYMYVLWLHVGDPLAFLHAYVAWVPQVHEGWDNYTMEGPLRALLLFPPILGKSVILGTVFFVAIPVIVFPFRKRLPLELLVFTVVGWLFLLDRNRQQEPFIDMLRWSAILVPVYFCMALWVEKIGDVVGGRWRAAKLFLALAVLSGSAVVYVKLLIRFSHLEWVS